jgi:TRAP transporter TAXI family solute receptor
MSARYQSKSAFLAVLTVSLLSASIVQAQDSRPIKHFRTDGPVANRLGWQINENTIGVISGNPNGTYLRLAYDMSAVLDSGNEFRVLPIIGKGGGQNIEDVRYLKGVDLGITQSVLLNRYKRTNEIGPIDDKIVYISKLNNEEMHLIVRADSPVKSIRDLAGKKVNFSDKGSGTHLSTEEIFNRLGVKVTSINVGQADGLEMLKKGEIDANILIAGKPTGSTSRIKASDGLKLLPVAFEKSLQEDFLPAVLTHEDYPDLIPPGQRIDTVAVVCVLIAYNWAKGTDRYNRVTKFVENFFPKIGEFQKKPRHPKWIEANLAATLPGWKRFDAAEEWLTKNHVQPISNERGQFEAYLAARATPTATAANAFAPEERNRLFEEFLEWKQTRGRR